MFDNATTLTSTLAYAAETTDKSRATLTMRQHLTDPRTEIPESGWEYVSDRTIRLLPAGTPFQQSAIYEFTYTAKEPLVAGLGFVATRDFVSFLRYAGAGAGNPLAEDVEHTYAFTVSQPARYLNDFQTLGFNEDEDGRQVFDGIENWIGGGSGVALNFRFAQPARTERNRQNHLYPEANFPFAFPLLRDPFTGKTGGRGVRCSLSGTCPKVVEVNSANEYWVKTGSLLHTDPRGNDLPDPKDVRFYLLSGVEHTVAGGTPGSRGVVPQQDLGFPIIPGVTYTGVITVRHLFDFGPLFDQGILTITPPAFSGPVYSSFVSRVDRDGNEIAGIRLPPVAAPIATTTGWALRRAEFGGNDGCESTGQWIPFKTTKAERLAAGDPRRSLEERYKGHDGYVKKVTKAAKKLQKRRLLLPADDQRYVDEAQASNVLR